MPTNIDRYKTDLDSLLEKGSLLLQAIIVQSGHPQKEQFSKEQQDKLPDFRHTYQTWYSEALKAIAQLFLDREEDFIGFYKSNRLRKDISKFQLYGFGLLARYTDNERSRSCGC
jgi:hypothetical protein